MNKLTLILTLFFSILMFASPAYADWEEIVKDAEGKTYYINFDSIRTNGGYVYWWDLTDFLEPKKEGILSGKVYNQGDCKVLRYKRLSYSFHKQPMGEGGGETISPPNPEWNYPAPNIAGEYILKLVCELAENL